MITLRQLRYFVALARFGHFGRAAADCAVTQPALSMQIRDLEKTLGVTLVERRPGDAVLTEIGREIARRGEDVLAASRDLVDFARHGAAKLSGRLALGVIPTLAPYLLPRLLPLLRQSYPDLRLELRETQTRALVDEVTSGRLDAAVLALPPGDGDLAVAELFDDPFLLAVPAGDPRASTGSVGIGDIDQSRLLLLEDGHCLRDQALAFCTSAPRGGFGASSLSTVMQLVAAGLGETLVPQIAADVETRGARLACLRFRDPQPSRRIGLAFRRTSPRRDDFEALAAAITASRAAIDATPTADSSEAASSKPGSSKTWT